MYEDVVFERNLPVNEAKIMKIEAQLTKDKLYKRPLASFSGNLKHTIHIRINEPLT